MPDRDTPASLGYRWPAEWERHSATWIAWPHNRETWPGRFDAIPAQFATLIRTLASYEPVCVLAGGDAVMRQAQQHVGGVAGVRLHDIPTDDAWVRDHGPMFLVGAPAAALVDWGYNAWGHKYPPFDRDNSVPRQIALQQGRRRFEPGMILEGGAVDGNGRGTILTTETCLLHPNRNPGLAQPEMERLLAEYCGATNILWLTGQLAGDDTDGHVDQLARFVAPDTVVAVVEGDAREENFEPLRENFARLQAMSDQDGRPLEVIPLPMPRPVFDGRLRLPASYANFYVANGVVIAPEFGDPADEVVHDRLAELFPDRTVCMLRATDLVLGLGAFHCLTQQEPAEDVTPHRT